MTQSPSTTQSMSIPAEANQLHLQRVGKALSSMQMNEVRRAFVNAFLAIYAKIESDELVDIGRLGLTFKKVQTAVGNDKIRYYRKDWERAKEHFAEALRQHPYRVCADEVGTRRRALQEAHSPKDDHLMQTLGELAGLATV